MGGSSYMSGWVDRLGRWVELGSRGGGVVGGS